MLPEVEGVEEVVNGEIRKMQPTRIIHADTVENLADLLRAKLDRSTVQVVVTAFGLVIRKGPPLTMRVPDIAVFIRKNVVEKDGYIHSARNSSSKFFPPPTRAPSAPKN
jgi:Uma2 family endonuclease